MNNSIDMKVLRDVTNRIFDFIEQELKITEVDLPHNFYWSMSDDVLYKMDQKPPELDCGSLADDFDFVAAAYNDPNQAIPLVLMHVAPLLQALSTAVPSYKSPPPKK